VLRLNPGDSLKVGVVNGNIGYAEVTRVAADCVEIEVKTLDIPPPPALPLTLILALPRPQMIKRILQTAACMGVQHLCLIQTSRVEKSFWSSPAISNDAMEEQCFLGLEQGMATQLPVITKHERFRPFMEDRLSDISAKCNVKLVAHPGDYPCCPSMNLQSPSILAVGPEGGFLNKEVNAFIEAGFSPVQIGARILKVETAVTALLAKLSL